MSDSPAFVPPFISSVRRPEVTKAAGRIREQYAHSDADPEHLDDADEPLPVREGLPAHYRMRAEPHYVETLVRGRDERSPVGSGPDQPPMMLRPGRATAAAAGSLAQALASIEASLRELPGAGRSLRERVLVELARAEAVRARWLAEAVAVLHREPLPVLETVELGAILRDVAVATGPEERLLGSAPRLTWPSEPAVVRADARMVVASVGGLLHALTALGGEAGQPGGVAARVVPGRDPGSRALEVSHAGVRLSASARARLFDADWVDHPAGPVGALMLAAARRVALAHGGYLDVAAPDAGGCRLTFGLPLAG